jgi:5-methylcytosine-specific restriction endonuclease McrA
MSLEANCRLKAGFMRRGITRCEVCGSTFALTWAHRFKRRHMLTVDQLSDFQNVILACIECHQRYLEWNKEVKEEWFRRLRGI